jgi:hypothetical protein
MAELLKLSGGHTSLELDPAELDAVASIIKELYGMPDVERDVMSSTHKFGSETFVFQNEWDDPCLISSSPEGDRILEALAERLAALIPEPKS